MQKTAVQLDFDGTVTEEDVSYLLLDTFAGRNWRKYLDEYSSGKITVGTFSKKVFGMMIADRKTMTDFVLNNPHVKVRPGLKEFIEHCKNIGIEVVIVSNGLTFYVEAILEKLGIDRVDIHAAENIFSPSGIKIRYLGPDGKELETGFKQAYTDMLCNMGYQVVYVGDGTSDIDASRKAHYVCATSSLLELCQAENLKCYPFNDFFDVIKIIKNLKLD